MFGLTQSVGEVMAAPGDKRPVEEADISTDDGQAPTAKAQKLKKSAKRGPVKHRPIRLATERVPFNWAKAVLDRPIDHPNLTWLDIVDIAPKVTQQIAQAMVRPALKKLNNTPSPARLNTVTPVAQALDAIPYISNESTLRNFYTFRHVLTHGGKRVCRVDWIHFDSGCTSLVISEATASALKLKRIPETRRKMAVALPGKRPAVVDKSVYFYLFLGGALRKLKAWVVKGRVRYSMIIGRSWGHSVESKENLKFETVKITNDDGQRVYLDRLPEAERLEGASFVTQVDSTSVKLPFDSVKRVSSQIVTEVLPEDTQESSEASDEEEEDIRQANALCWSAA